MSFVNRNKVALAGLVALAALPSTLAHGHVVKWSIGGTEYAGFNPSNAAEYGATPERPTTNADQGFADFTTDVIATGGTDTGLNTLVADGKGGDTVVATWNTWPESHKGSVAEFMARCPDDKCAGVAGADLDWFKISEATYDAATDSWPTDSIASGLTWTCTLPSDIPSGQYLLRHELLAMHSTGAPQFYPVAIQLQLESSGTVTPSPTGKFPDMYLTNNMATSQNIYAGSENNAAFVPPGVAVYSGSGSTTPSTSAAATSTSAAATETSAAASITESAAETSAAETSAAETSAAETSAAETSATETSAVETSAVETSAAETSAVETATATSASAPAATTTAVAGDNLQTYTGAVEGISAPAVTADGDKFLCNDNIFNFKVDALTRSCDVQRNLCLNAANAKPNAEVSGVTAQCETQATECKASASSARRRDAVIARFAKRAL
ncbi:hypothetical protein IAT38_001640 [Cryptococcus sp. DSM 104549]